MFDFRVYCIDLNVAEEQLVFCVIPAFMKFIELTGKISNFFHFSTFQEQNITKWVHMRNKVTDKNTDVKLWRIKHHKIKQDWMD